MATKKKAPVRKKPARKKKQKRRFPDLSQRTRILLASAFLLVFVGVCLFALVTLREKVLPGADFVYEEPETPASTQKIYAYADIYHLIETQLLNGPQSMGWRKLPPRDEVQVRRIFGEFPSEHFLAELASHIEQTGSSAELRTSREKGIIHLYWNNQLQLELKYRIPQDTGTGRGKIAIIMDDMGGSLSVLRELLALDLPVTPSILPGIGKTSQTTDLLQEADREYMIHIPMQPRSYPKISPGSNALLLGQSEETTRMLVRKYIEEVPGAVGGNNHMGSRYTEEAGPMRVVLDELKQHNRFFVDSRTISSSVAFAEARKMGLQTATRDIFLDNREDVEYIRGQIRKMVSMAKKNREVIAICHPYSETFDALRLELPWLKQQSVDFVAASQLVHVY